MVEKVKACFVLCAGELAVAVLVKHGEGGKRCSPELTPRDEAVLVSVNNIEAGIVLGFAELAVSVSIQLLKKEARHCLHTRKSLSSSSELVLADFAILVNVNHVKACFVLLPRQLPIPVFVKNRKQAAAELLL